MVLQFLAPIAAAMAKAGAVAAKAGMAVGGAAGKAALAAGKAGLSGAKILGQGAMQAGKSALGGLKSAGEGISKLTGKSILGSGDFSNTASTASKAATQGGDIKSKLMKYLMNSKMMQGGSGSQQQQPSTIEYGQDNQYTPIQQPGFAQNYQGMGKMISDMLAQRRF